ncbi:hypothetical protein BJX70DRAFT_49765 [Aspergillus crustosus]
MGVDISNKSALNGNSRDPPQVFRMVRGGCLNFTASSQAIFDKHVSKCLGVTLPSPTPKSSLFPCPEKDCAAGFETCAGMRAHWKKQHEWVEQPCHQCGDDSITYPKYIEWCRHSKNVHAPRIPCSQLACKIHSSTYTKDQLRNHLKKVHPNLTQSDIRTIVAMIVSSPRANVSNSTSGSQFTTSSSTTGTISGRIQKNTSQRKEPDRSTTARE